MSWETAGQSFVWLLLTSTLTFWFASGVSSDPGQDISRSQGAFRSIGELFGETGGDDKGALLRIERIGSLVPARSRSRRRAIPLLGSELCCHFIANRLLKFGRKRSCCALVWWWSRGRGSIALRLLAGVVTCIVGILQLLRDHVIRKPLGSIDVSRIRIEVIPVIAKPRAPAPIENNPRSPRAVGGGQCAGTNFDDRRPEGKGTGSADR